MEVERHQRELDYAIERGESDVQRLQGHMEAELDALRRKKLLAENNLAGATYEQSISSEMQAASEKYRIQIQVAQDRVAQLRAEAADLRKRRQTTP